MLKRTVIMALLVLSLVIASQSQEPGEVMTQVRIKYKEVTDFRAEFTQIYCDATAGTCTKFEGRLDVKRPNLLRLEVKKPEAQNIVCDGQTLWVHLVKDKQVVKMDLDKSNNYLVWLSPLTKLLSAKVKNGCATNGEYQIWLDMPELASLFKEVKIIVNRQDFLLVGLDVTEVNGNTAEYTFSKIKLNPKFKNDYFTFVLPKGVNLINSE